MSDDARNFSVAGVVYGAESAHGVPRLERARMVRRLVTVLSAAALVVTSLGGAASATRSSADGFAIRAADVFSPDADGTKDTLRVRATLPHRARVRLSVVSLGGNKEYRTVDLGQLPAGTHTWTWDGSNRAGTFLADATYTIRLTEVADNRAVTVATEEVRVDTGFSAELTTPTFGAGRRAVARVYPRTTVITDTIDLDAVSYERGGEVARLELVIRDATGRVVHRADVDEPIPYAGGAGVYATGRTVPWAAVRGGKPLPRGRYTAVVVGADRAGNTGRSTPVRIWVSRDRLEWVETTTTVTPQASVVGICEYSSANGCGDGAPCGVVLPSTIYAGGLSHRPRACSTPDPKRSDAASAQHVLEVPEATGVRGVAAVRVTFVGAPTTAGEPDTGTLSVPGGAGASTVIGTSGRSDWVDDPSWGEGLEASYPISQRDPAAMWTFSTTDANQVDVATYTVDVRYLAVAD